jgi:AcrR family transcriptional regulator
MKEILARRKEAERQERMRQILKAAGKLFLKKGYTNTTMRDICRKAELSTGAVYFYFKSKEEIYSRICEDNFRHMQNMFSQALDPQTSPIERFRALALGYLSFYLEHREQWEIIKAFRNVGLSPHLLKGLIRLDMQLFSSLQETVEEYLVQNKHGKKRNSEEVSVGMWGSVEGLLAIHSMGFFKSTSLDLEKMILNQLDIFLKGIS